jgi:large subunit ribosomal protein L10
MITIQKKHEIVDDLVGRFKRANGYYLVDFMGMTVSAAIRFRRDLKKNGMEYKIAKNSLIKRALQETGGSPIPDKNFFGASGVVFGYADPLAPSKIIKEHFEKSERPKLKAAVIEGVFYDGSQLKTIAALPSKPDIISGIIGSLHAPISGIVGSINAVMRDVAYIIEEVAKKKAS